MKETTRLLIVGFRESPIEGVQERKDVAAAFREERRKGNKFAEIWIDLARKIESVK